MGIVYITEQKFLILMLFFIKYFLTLVLFGVLLKKSSSISSLWIYSLRLFSKSLIILTSMYKSLTYFYFCMWCGGGQESVCSRVNMRVTYTFIEIESPFPLDFAVNQMTIDVRLCVWMLSCLLLDFFKIMHQTTVIITTYL